MTRYPAPICMRCVHLEKEPTGPLRCDAYPDGVPEAIWQSVADHTKPYKGDHGIQFEFGQPSAVLPPPKESA